MIVLIITSFCLDFVVAFYLIIYNDESKLLKNIIITILCIFLILITKYFGEIKQKSKQIFEMNEALEIKIMNLEKLSMTMEHKFLIYMDFVLWKDLMI